MTVTLWEPTVGSALLPAASRNFQPANPASTVSATLVMMGVGSTCTFTPVGTGKVRVAVTCQMGQATAAQINIMGVRYGTGAAPANGAAVTGTRFGGVQDASLRPSSFSAASSLIDYAATDTLTLTPGTAYWFDVCALTGSVSDAVSIQNISMSFMELIN